MDGQDVHPSKWVIEMGQSFCRACRMLGITEGEGGLDY